MCEWFIDNELCYRPIIEVLYSIAVILPAGVYIALVKPHDCFKCLSMDEELRITDFQLDPDERVRRAYEVKYGGFFQCWPTCGKRLRFRKLESFERRVRATSI